MQKFSVSESSISGMGLIATTDIEQGQKILHTRGKIIEKEINSSEESESIQNWIGVDQNIWLVTDNTPLRFINHSCNANAAILGNRSLVALTPIKQGEEITIDYSMTDADPYWSIDCTCGHETCRKEVRAIYSISPEVFKRHYPYIINSFQRLFLQHYINSTDTKNNLKIE